MKHILADLQFEGLSEILYQKYNISYNAPSAYEHVGEIERSIRILKERTRATLSRLPYKERIPKIIIEEALANTVLMVNSFPPKSGITTHLSPRTIMTGRKINYKTHCRMPFGDYAQVHENEQPRNSMAERTLGAICLGPVDNVQGGYKFMSLRTGKKIKRYAWTPIPMTNEVINRVIEIAAKERGPRGITLRSATKDQDEEEYIDDDDIQGVYGDDIRNNPFPSQGIDSDDDEEDSVIDEEEESFPDNMTRVYEEENDIESEPEENAGITEEIEDLAQEVETVLDNEIDEFRDLEEIVDRELQELEEEMDETDDSNTPEKREKKKPSSYIPSFKGKQYEYEDDSIDEVMIVQVLQKVFQQYYFNKSLKQFDDKGKEAVKK